MSNKRMVHTSIWASGQVSKLSREARLLYIGLITFADDEGRLKGSPALLRSEVFPYDEDVSIKDVGRWLADIIKLNLVKEYMVDDESYLFHPKWSEYQTLRADRRKESHVPAPDCQPDDNQVSTKSPHKVSKGKVSKEKIIDMPDRFDEFWVSYPNKKAKKKAEQSWSKLKMTEELFKVIMSGLEKAKSSPQWKKDDGQFIPHPTTWLNQERWNDEVSVGTTKKTDKF
jgi:hypothetical protein